MTANNNEINADKVRSVVQAGDVYGDVVFNEAGADPRRPGRASIAPPLDRHVGLHGRAPQVSEVMDAVRRNDGSVVVVHGAGGCGKTSVALEAVVQLGKQARVWWLDGSDVGKLEAGLREVALDAGAPRHEVDRAWSGDGSAVELLKRVLADVRWPWVLVVDDADDRRLPKDWWPALRQSSGAVLVTSRDGALWPGARQVRVGVLTEESAVELLRSLAPHAGTEAEAAALARALGYLPLPLHLAGRYLARAPGFPTLGSVALPIGFGQYQETFQQRFADLDKLHVIGSGLGERELLSRTWELSLDLLAANGLPYARPLLRWLSCFAQAPVPCVLIEHSVLATTAVFAGATEQSLTRTVIALCDFGLVEMVNYRASVECLVLHPVIREANRVQEDVREHFQTYLRLCMAVLEGGTAGAPATPLLAALIPHCTHIPDAIHDARGSFDRPDVWELNGTAFACVAGSYARMNKRWDAAHALFQHALMIRLSYLGAEAASVLAVRHEIAWLDWEQHRTRRSEEDYAELVVDCRDSLGDAHPVTLICRLALASVREGFDDDVESEYRALVELSGQVEQAEVVGLCAQLSLVQALWRRGHDCTAEQFRLLHLLRDAGEQVLAGLPDLWVSIGEQLATYFGWQEFLNLWACRHEAG